MAQSLETETIDDVHGAFEEDYASIGREQPEAAALPDPICALTAPPAQAVQWIVDDLFSSGDVGLMVGDGGSFKSSASIHIAAAVAGGYKAFDRFQTCGPANVLVCSAEDPGSVIQMRLEAFVRGHDWNRVQVLGNFHYFALAGIRLKHVAWKTHLSDVVARLEPAMIVLDPFVDLSGLDEENSNSEASGIMGYARELARASSASVVFVHHGNKSSEARTQSRIRGATTIANASRGTLFFEYTDAGVMVEQIKMTYAEKVPPFMLQRDIVSEPTNKAVWITAKLATVRPETARLSRAEEFVLAQVQQSPGILNSRGIRDAAKGSGIWSSDVDKAVKMLFGRHLIYSENGANKSKIWFPTPDAKDISDLKSVCPEGHFGTPGTPRPERAKADTAHLNSPAAVSLPYGKGGTPHEAAGFGTPEDEFDESQAEASDS